MAEFCNKCNIDILGYSTTEPNPSICENCKNTFVQYIDWKYYARFTLMVITLVICITFIVLVLRELLNAISSNT